ncbi:MAG: glycosyltransferase [Candidatus Stahlbacteria bacterium]|nr:MAG: glycosyltransferase [Candidatus Stahlbacteria bacterium]
MGKIVTIIHYSALPIIGGVEFIISKHSELMKQDGLDVRIIAGDGNPDVLIPELKASYYNEIQQIILSGKEPDNFTQEVEALQSKLYQEISASDVLIVHNMFTMHFNLVATAAIAKLARNLRTITWVHDIAYIDSTYNLPPPTISPLKYISEPMDHLEYVTITKYRKELLVDFLSVEENKVNVISNGIDPYILLPQKMKEIAEELDILSFYPVIVYPSRMTRRKNYEFAIEIVGELEGNPLLLLSAPPDPHNPTFSSYKEELYRLSGEKGVSLIFFGDFVSIEDIYPFYSLGDLLLITSRMEGFGLPVVEAALLRIPAALSNIPPLIELGKHFQNTIFFDLDEDPKIVADRISLFLKNSSTVKDRKEVIERYSWKRIYQEKIRELLKIS